MTMLFKSPKIPQQTTEAPPQVPTIDTAQRARNETNRLRGRRGVGGNIYAGAYGAVGKQLTGQ